MSLNIGSQAIDHNFEILHSLNSGPWAHEESWAEQVGLAAGTEIVAVNRYNVQCMSVERFTRYMQRRPLNLTVFVHEGTIVAGTRVLP